MLVTDCQLLVIFGDLLLKKSRGVGLHSFSFHVSIFACLGGRYKVFLAFWNFQLFLFSLSRKAGG